MKRLRESGQAFGCGAAPRSDAAQSFCEAVHAVIEDSLRLTACSFSFQILRTIQEQEDAIQEAIYRTFQVALRRCQEHAIRWEESDETLWRYFNKIARRELGKERQKAWTWLSRRAVELGSEAANLVDPGTLAEEDSSDVMDLLASMVQNGVDQRILRLRGEDYTYEEISSQLKAELDLEMSPSALRKRFERTKDTLRASFRERLVAENRGD